MPRESAIQAQCVKMIRNRGWWAEKIHVDEMQSRGLPDVVACMAGMFFGIEFKLPGKKPTDMQKFHIWEIRRAGGRAGVIDIVFKMQEVLRCIDAGSPTPYLTKGGSDDDW